MFEKIKRKIPKVSQLRNFLQILSKKQKRLFLAFFVLALASLFALDYSYYINHTQVKPAVGGEYREGIVGQPRFVNPIYLSNNDVDKDLVELIFSGLLDYTAGGKIEKELAKNYTVTNKGKTYEVVLKDDIKWHDGEKIQADDVIFTINAIQSPQYKSPLRIEWSGINVKEKSSRRIEFNLEKPFASFPEKLASLKILPKHVFEKVSPQNFPWELTSKKYLIGSGPFKVKEIIKNEAGFIKRINLERNENFPNSKVFIENFSCFFYENTEDMLKARTAGQIDGFSISNPSYLSQITPNRLKKYKIQIPRYFAVFYNLTKDKITNDKDLREALSLGIKRDKIINEVFKGRASKTVSPVLSNFFNLAPPKETFNFAPQKAEQILEDLGYKLNKETGIREKTPEQEASFTFDQSLSLQDQGEDVRNLQKCLSRDSDVYPEAQVTGYYGSKTEKAVTRFQEKFAKEILLQLGLTGGTGKAGPSTIEKLNEFCKAEPKESIPLEIEITTTNSFPLNKIANAVKENWENLGVKVILNQKEIGEMQTQIFKEKDFEALLFGEALGIIPDPFPFWHSTQIKYPGLNIVGFESEKADTLLEEARENTDKKTRDKALENFQDILLKSIPAKFIARGNYFYLLPSKIKGEKTTKAVSPSERLTNVENWYINTKRVW